MALLTVRAAANVARFHFHCFAAEQRAKKPTLTAKEIRAKWREKGNTCKGTPAELADVLKSVDDYVSGKTDTQRQFMRAPIFSRIAKERFGFSLLDDNETKATAKKPRRKAIYVDIATACQ